MQKIYYYELCFYGDEDAESRGYNPDKACSFVIKTEIPPVISTQAALRILFGENPDEKQKDLMQHCTCIMQVTEEEAGFFDASSLTVKECSPYGIYYKQESSRYRVTGYDKDADAEELYAVCENYKDAELLMDTLGKLSADDLLMRRTSYGRQPVDYVLIRNEYGETVSASVPMVTKRSVLDSIVLTAAEKNVICQMLEQETYQHNDAFIAVNQSGLIEMNAKDLFDAVNHMVSLNILKRRECDGTAYEWKDKQRLLEYMADTKAESGNGEAFMGKHLEGVYGEWSFTVPSTTEEIQKEGKAMKNALASPYFVKEFMNRKLILVFLKKNGKPQVDIAIKDNEVFHAVRFGNSEISCEDYDLIKRWASDKNLKMEKKDGKELQQESEDSVVQY